MFLEAKVEVDHFMLRLLPLGGCINISFPYL